MSDLSPTRMFSIIVRALDTHRSSTRERSLSFPRLEWEEAMKCIVRKNNMKTHIDNMIIAAANFRYAISSRIVTHAMNADPYHSRIYLSGNDQISEDIIVQIFDIIANDFMKSYGDDQVWIDMLYEIGNDMNANKSDMISGNDGTMCNELTTVSGHIGSYEILYAIRKKRRWVRCRRITEWEWFGDIKLYIIPNISEVGTRIGLSAQC